MLKNGYEITVTREHWDKGRASRGQGLVSETCAVTQAIKAAIPDARYVSCGVFDIGISRDEEDATYAMPVELKEFIAAFDSFQEFPGEITAKIRKIGG